MLEVYNHESSGDGNNGVRALSEHVVADGNSFIADQVGSNRETNGGLCQSTLVQLDNTAYQLIVILGIPSLVWQPRGAAFCSTSNLQGRNSTLQIPREA